MQARRPRGKSRFGIALSFLCRYCLTRCSLDLLAVAPSRYGDVINDRCGSKPEIEPSLFDSAAGANALPLRVVYIPNCPTEKAAFAVTTVSIVCGRHGSLPDRQGSIIRRHRVVPLGLPFVAAAMPSRCAFDRHVDTATKGLEGRLELIQS